MRLAYYYLPAFLLVALLSAEDWYPCAVVGYFHQADGIGGQSLGLLEQLIVHGQVAYVPSRFFTAASKGAVAEWIHRVPLLSNSDSVGVAFFVDMLTLGGLKLYRRIPRSYIRIAYSMIETDRLSELWVAILNNHLDLVIVPDQFLKEAYHRCGVRIPIYVVPLGLHRTPFEYPPHSRGAVFTVGYSSSFTKRKNHLAIAQAFCAAFGSRRDVRLILHGRNGDPELIDQLRQYCNTHTSGNITVIHEQLDTKSYFDLLSSFDCYLSLSMGEGYALGPREALAMGIPCILSDHTAHHSIISHGYALPVACDSQELAPCIDGNAGVYYRADIQDAARALLEVERYYQRYQALALQARSWIERYRWDNIIGQYLVFIRPSCVIMGTCNTINDGALFTNDQKLVHKYLHLQSMSRKNIAI